ncbi:MAG: HNH endonuclease [Nitrosotalea sp.]
MQAIIANITWNDRGWTFPETHSQAGHGYVKDKPGHECLNFVFNKPDIDNDEWIYGHFQRTSDPKNFQKGGLIVFYSRDFRAQTGKIVGIYGNAEIITPIKNKNYPEFENGELITNTRADPILSLRFPVYLESSKYFKGRAVGQVGFTYIPDDLVVSIIQDEIRECEKVGNKEGVLKLQKIYIFFTGKQISSIPTLEDLENDQFKKETVEMKSLSNFSTMDVESLLTQYSKPGFITHDAPQKSIVNTYERDSKLSAIMKIKNNNICQICNIQTFESKDGHFYTESHHIIPRAKGGADDPKNILILCPTCHKKFDKGSDKTLIEIYHLLKLKGLFSNFKILKKIGEISEVVYNEILKE